MQIDVTYDLFSSKIFMKTSFSCDRFLKYQNLTQTEVQNAQYCRRQSRPVLLNSRAYHSPTSIKKQGNPCGKLISLNSPTISSRLALKATDQKISSVNHWLHDQFFGKASKKAFLHHFSHLLCQFGRFFKKRLFHSDCLGSKNRVFRRKNFTFCGLFSRNKPVNLKLKNYNARTHDNRRV